jgi:hypothetical protein
MVFLERRAFSNHSALSLFDSSLVPRVESDIVGFEEVVDASMELLIPPGIRRSWVILLWD